MILLDVFLGDWLDIRNLLSQASLTDRTCLG
jgi:hypothetical protein